jgi:hypothetical protein
LANVTRLCKAKFAGLLLSEGDQFRRVSFHIVSTSGGGRFAYEIRNGSISALPRRWLWA